MCCLTSMCYPTTLLLLSTTKSSQKNSRLSTRQDSSVSTYTYNLRVCTEPA